MHAVIQKQVRLPLRRAVEIAAKSLRVRIGRSVLTLLTIVMAIAFLANVAAMRVCEPGMKAAAMAAQGIAVEAAPVGSLARTLWLVGLSLLVCTVGITNAMLMSVMERFREIGTMKCLGAVDSFILKLFLLESLFLGLVGSAIGAFLGVVLALVTLWHSYGSLAHLSWGWIPVLMGVSTVFGVLLTSVAAAFPAHKAAKMAPIEALRVDV